MLRVGDAAQRYPPETHCFTIVLWVWPMHAESTSTLSGTSQKAAPVERTRPAMSCTAASVELNQRRSRLITKRSNDSNRQAAAL